MSIGAPQRKLFLPLFDMAMCWVAVGQWFLFLKSVVKKVKGQKKAVSKEIQGDTATSEKEKTKKGFISGVRKIFKKENDAV